MREIIFLLFVFCNLLTNNLYSKEVKMILKLKDGDVEIQLFSDIAPNHVERIKTLADSGKYDGVIFHRVIDGFMAQTGDVQFGNSKNPDYDNNKAGSGGSDLNDLKADFYLFFCWIITFFWHSHKVCVSFFSFFPLKRMKSI